jgi:hypothetical protein
MDSDYNRRRRAIDSPKNEQHMPRGDRTSVPLAFALAALGHNIASDSPAEYEWSCHRNRLRFHAGMVRASLPASGKRIPRAALSHLHSGTISPCK